MAVIPGFRVDDEKGVSTITWANVTTADTAKPVDVSDLFSKSIHVFSAGAGTAQLRVSNDGVNFINVGTALAANTLTNMTVDPKQVDFNPIATATVTITLVGKRQR